MAQQTIKYMHNYYTHLKGVAVHIKQAATNPSLHKNTLHGMVSSSAGLVIEALSIRR